jgi:hypothetical protein
MLQEKYKDIIEETRSLLKEKDEWLGRYADYARKISSNIDFIRQVRKTFREWSPLNIYINISSAKNAKNSVGFELRYLGQTVATLRHISNVGLKLSTIGYEDKNRRYFECSLILSAVDWDSNKAKEFRDFFNNRNKSRINGAKRNEEHRLQSLFLTEFSKQQGKVLRYVKPVMIGGIRFPMPTPIGASNHNKPIKYSKQHGGGIDILARTGTGGKATHLCIMELKDENTLAETPGDAMKQAVAYTTFIHELLRSDSGKTWWKIFGFGGSVPNPLELYAACVMPSSENNDYSFRDVECNIENDKMRLQYIYFTTLQNGRIIINPGDTTLVGTK